MYQCSPQLFSITRRWVQGSQEGVREGGLCPLRTRKFLKPGSLQMPFPGI